MASHVSLTEEMGRGLPAIDLSQVPASDSSVCNGMGYFLGPIRDPCVAPGDMTGVGDWGPEIIELNVVQEYNLRRYVGAGVGVDASFDV